MRQQCASFLYGSSPGVWLGLRVSGAIAKQPRKRVAEPLNRQTGSDRACGSVFGRFFEADDHLSGFRVAQPLAGESFDRFGIIAQRFYRSL